VAAEQLVSPKVRTRIEKWKERLVDISRRNRLLYFRSSKSSTLEIISPGLLELFEGLMNSESPWSFWVPPKQTQEGLGLTPANGEEEIEEPTRRRRRRYLKFSEEDPGRLYSCLQNLYRRSRTDYEERGVRILHLTFGMLAWKDNTEKILSPLILFPVELSRGSARDPFELSTCEEDPVLNPALAVKLGRDFGIDLPPLPEDWDGTSLDSYFRQVKKVLKSDWIITSEVWMGLFSFLKIAMYRDLEEHKDLLARNPIISALSGETVAKDAFGPGVIDPRQLDETVSPENSHLVLDADSSQLACIEACKNGSSFVLQGPPGTGKSQTICNLIAESLALGKTVLFVSEKMAALEVVYKRLKECKLDQYVLELHSHKANKREVVQELYRCLANRCIPGEGLTALEVARLAERRKSLNNYVAALHQKQPPLGVTPYQALSRLAGLKSVPRLTFRLKGALSFQPETLDRLRELSALLARVWYIAEAKDEFPWMGNSDVEFSVFSRHEYEELIRNLLSSIDVVKTVAAPVADVLGIDPLISLSDVHWLRYLLLKLKDCPVPPASWVWSPETFVNAAHKGCSELAKTLEEWLPRCASEDSDWSKDCTEYIRLSHLVSERGKVDEALRLDLDNLHSSYSNKYRSFFRFLSGAYRRDSRLLRSVTVRPLDYRESLAFLDAARNLQRLHKRITKVLDWCLEVRQHFAERPMADKLVTLISAGGPLPPSTSDFDSAYESLVSLIGDLKEHFEKGWPRFSKVAIDETSLAQLSHGLERMLNELDGLRDWVDYKQIRDELVNSGYEGLLSSLINRLPSRALVPDCVERSFWESWVDEAFKANSALRGFRTEDHERLIAEFKSLDEKHWRFGPYRVMSAVNARIPDISTVYEGGELQVLQREANKRRRLLPVRKLFERIPNLLLSIKPVLLMSPLSVSQFLNPQVFSFDLVVFDEASQICAEDAVGAIYRGKQLVVCGDDKQLPPTAFFQMGMSEDDYYDDSEQDDASAEYESVLEACRGAGLPTLPLLWHYRSKDESLIAFSNRQFYHNSLITFPSCQRKRDSTGVRFEYVKDGVYDRGGKRDNPIEAERVVQIVLQHFEKHPDKSLGVVAFSVQQAETIENLLEVRMKERPELETFMGRDRLEGFFVKNLENVQGDERDVIIFSVGYGKDKWGRITMNFGPLNRVGGERRLNVAITRAREQVILVSSIRADDLDLASDLAPGVLNLYRYLSYAERGPDALEMELTGRDTESPLEDDVAAEIRELGYEVVPQVGCSGYRIDLGVVDPVDPGRFILGVECDGATYHSAATARDRDRLRHQILERLGWRIHRIWSPDWINRRDLELERLRTAIASARIRVRPSEERKPRILQVKTQETPVNGSLTTGEALLGWQRPYQVAQLDRCRFDDFNSPYFLASQVQMLARIVDIEAPVSVPLATRRLLKACGIQRAGGQIRQTMQRVIWAGQKAGSMVERNGFLWKPGQESLSVVRIPVLGDPETARTLDDIPTEEIVVAVTEVCRAALGISRESLVSNVARVFGFGRTGSEVSAKIGAVVDELVSKGVLRDNNGQIVLA